jgi:hypothetical protein
MGQKALQKITNHSSLPIWDEVRSQGKPANSASIEMVKATGSRAKV